LTKGEHKRGASDRCVPLFGQFDQAKLERTFVDIQRIWYQDSTTPVKLLLSSPGGDAFAAISFRNAIKLDGILLHVVVVGEAHSAAITILCSGVKRSAQRGAQFFFHPLEVVVAGSRYKRVELQVYIGTLDNIDGDDTAIIAGITRKTSDEIAGWKTAEKTFDAAGAKECGLIDEIIDFP